MAVAAVLQVLRAVERSRVGIFLLALEVGSTVIGFILHGQKVVGGTTLVLLPRSVLVNFGLQAIGSVLVLLGHEVVSLRVAAVALLSRLRVLILLLLPLLLTDALVRHGVVLVKPIRLYSRSKGLDESNKHSPEMKWWLVGSGLWMNALSVYLW